VSFANLRLPSSSYQLLTSAEGSASGNFQLVDRNGTLAARNVEKHHCNVDKSISNGKMPVGKGTLPDGDQRKRRREGAG
jgi:hypothetical protein